MSLLLVSIIFPIFFGSLVYAALQSIARSRMCWRLMSVLAGILCIAGVYDVLFYYWLDRNNNQILGNLYSVLVKGL